MKTYQTKEIRNIALLGNSGAGKTTLGEALLFTGGVIDRRGSIDQKNTVSDFNPVEHEQENSVFSSVLFAEYNKHKINIIDNPGLDDFSGQAAAALNPADTALIVLNAQNGVEVGAEIHFRFTDESKVPVIFIINGLDHEKTNFEKTIETIREKFGNGAAITQFPVNEGDLFDSIIDVLKMKMYKYSGDGKKAEILDIPEEYKARAEELHNALVEKAAENDEALMELFFEKDTLNEEEMRKGIKEGLLQRSLFPVFCTSAKKNVGVDRLMEFITNVVPAPDEMPAPLNNKDKEVACNPQGPASLFVFKTSVEEHVGEVNYFKVLSGEVKEGMDMINTNTANKERISQLFVVAGKKKDKVPSMVAGDIGATVKLKGTKTNHTLNASGQDWSMPPIKFPSPRHRTAVKAKNEGDDEKLGEVLQRFHDEDPTIIIEYSKELKQILIHGLGEHHLNILKWHLDNIFKIDVDFITPKIPYRETITKVAQASYRHKKQSGGAGQFGEVHLVIEPYKEGTPDPAFYKVNGKEIKISVRDKQEQNLPWGGKLIFYNCIVGGSIDARFLPAILKGIMERMETGPLTGSYARDIRVAVYDGKMHPVDSNEISFKLAGRNAFSIAFKEANPKIMEPVYEVNVWVPSDRMGDVMSDLQTRRAIVMGMNSEKGFERITAKVPLAEMNKYSTSLSSLTGGRAMYSMEFSEYVQVPGEIQEELLKAYEAEQEEE